MEMVDIAVLDTVSFGSRSSSLLIGTKKEADVVELTYTPDLESGAFGIESSNLSIGTKNQLRIKIYNEYFRNNTLKTHLY